MTIDNAADLASRHVPLRLHELAVGAFENFGLDFFRFGQLTSIRAMLPQMKSTKNCVNAGETVSHLACMVN